MKGFKRTALVIIAIVALSVTGSALAGKGGRGNDQGNNQGGNDQGGQTVKVPDGGSTLMLLGAALLGLEGWRRRVSKTQNC